MGWFRRVLACSATQPVPIGFGVFQPATFNKNTKTAVYSSRMGRVARADCLGGSGIN